MKSFSQTQTSTQGGIARIASLKRRVRARSGVG
jgi:hypothetical protein